MLLKTASMAIKDLMAIDTKILSFIYMINKKDFSENEIEYINAEAKIRDRIKAIKAKGAFLEYCAMSDISYQLDLELFDDKMP
jgi:hypothetical protein